ncbi:hypothetical protein POM88_054821 [Heracleum sosnowskyi]|uniref:Pectin acetylesterase n=1 Tax=Heracleum sosnowskyi TaxID=360622 RepID=A0AAD8GM13_9APIA|nr:hypothetical protein POM88_054821 [Heracleum sosnowskyi]
MISTGFYWKQLGLTSFYGFIEQREDTDDTNYRISSRDFFVPTQENWLLLAADYSQLELRLMAHFSKDPSLVELLSKRNSDVFRMIASKWTGKVDSSVSSIEREHTKKLIYGILYGMGANTIVELECKFRLQFLSAAPAVDSSKSRGMFLNSCYAHCQTGTQETWLRADSPLLDNKTIAKAVGDWS